MDDGHAPEPKVQDPLSVFFTFFNEIGIIGQLSSALFQSRLPDGVTVAHFSVLNHLIRVRDGQTPLKLADAFQVPKTTMTHTLAGLEKQRLVDIRRNPEDGRSKQVWITETGRAFRDTAIGLLASDVERLAGNIDLAAVAGVTPVLTSVRKVMDADRD